MRSLLTLLACLMLVMTASGGSAQADEPGCSEMMGQMVMHVAADCDEVPTDADKNYPHCHTSCHGHHIAAPISNSAPGQASNIDGAYAPTPKVILTAHQVDQTLRPPKA